MKHFMMAIVVLGMVCASQRQTVNVAAAPLPQAPMEVIDAEEQAIIELVIGEYGRQNSKNITQIVLGDRTDYDDPTHWAQGKAHLTKALLSLKPDTLNDFLAKQTDVRQIPPELHISMKYALENKRNRLHKVEASLLQNKNGWMEFAQEYPGSYGIHEFSRIGFDRLHRQALMFVTITFGIDGGSGTYVLLEKSANRWKIKSMKSAYIS
jgi:hypothetical protein